MNRTVYGTDAQAVHDLAEALAQLGLGAVMEEPSSRRRADLAVDIPGGKRVLIEVKALANPSPADLARLVERRRPSHTAVVVSDRLVPAGRQVLNDAGWGWLDRGGHLRLRAPGLVLDADVPTTSTAPSRARPALDTGVGLDVACALLASPNDGLSVRDVVDVTGRSLASVHEALRRLRIEGLVDQRGRPITPELFWEVSSRWRPRRVALGGSPAPGDASRTGQLELGLDEPDATAGWALGDTVAAYAYGAPAPVGSAYPPDFYVPTERIVRVARQLYGDATRYESRAATVAVPPAGWACRRRVDIVALALDEPWAEWPAVHPVFAALDLALDPARGREILDGWTPPEPFVRVW
ncbi:MAG: transcriptional regulator [Acidimicrobiales bacterium]